MGLAEPVMHTAALGAPHGRAQVKRGGIAAWSAFPEGHVEEAVEEMPAAAKLADEMEKSGVTPGNLQPAQELLGDLLMEADRPAEALEAYEASLPKWPGCLNTLLGAARAAEEAGDAHPWVPSC